MNASTPQLAAVWQVAGKPARKSRGCSCWLFAAVIVLLAIAFVPWDNFPASGTEEEREPVSVPASALASVSIPSNNAELVPPPSVTSTVDVAALQQELSRLESRHQRCEAQYEALAAAAKAQRQVAYEREYRLAFRYMHLLNRALAELSHQPTVRHLLELQMQHAQQYGYDASAAQARLAAMPPPTELDPATEVDGPQF